MPDDIAAKLRRSVAKANATKKNMWVDNGMMPASFNEEATGARVLGQDFETGRTSVGRIKDEAITGGTSVPRASFEGPTKVGNRKPEGASGGGAAAGGAGAVMDMDGAGEPPVIQDEHPANSAGMGGTKPVHAAVAQRQPTPEEMMKWADDLLASKAAEHEAAIMRGSAVQPVLEREGAPPAWLTNYMSKQK